VSYIWVKSAVYPCETIGRPFFDFLPGNFSPLYEYSRRGKLLLENINLGVKPNPTDIVGKVFKKIEMGIFIPLWHQDWPKTGLPPLD